MHNKVVTMAARAMRELGATTVRFNFRGTGDSEGAFDEGRGEVDDLHAVAAWVREQRPGAALWLAGASSGAYVSLRAAASLTPDVLVSIAPPARGLGLDSMTPPHMPRRGGEDLPNEIVDTPTVSPNK